MHYAYMRNLDAIREEVEHLLAMFTTFTGGWVGGWCGEVKNRANLSQVRFRLKLRLSLAIWSLWPDMMVCDLKW